MAKLTKTMIDRLPAKGERYEVADDALAGFYIRVNRGGSKTAIVRYFKDGRAGSYTLGKLGEHFPFAEARAQARKILGDVARGQDPARDRKRRRDAPTVAALAERFMSDHAAPYCKPRTVALYETIVRCHVVPELGAMRIEELERCDVERLHQRVGKEAPYMANRVIAVLSCMMSKAEAWGYRRPQSNPCYRVPKFRERKVERFLSGEERAQLAEALAGAEQAPRGKHGYVCPGAITAIRLLELTGARCGEIVGLEWPMVDLDRSCLRLPDSKTGAKVIPLSPQAVAFLRELERKASKGIGAEGGRLRGWVCLGERGGPVHNLERAWRAIRKRAGLEDVRLHDLRHSAASDMAGAGLSLPIIGQVLGHKSQQTTARYTHLADRHRQEGARIMGEEMERSTREGAERLRQEKERRKLQRAAGAEHGEGEAIEGVGEGATVIPLGGNVIRFPGKRG